MTTAATHGPTTENEQISAPTTGLRLLYEATYNKDLNFDGDKLDQVGWDEVLYSWGGSILDDVFHNMVADLAYNRMVIVNSFYMLRVENDKTSNLEYQSSFCRNDDVSLCASSSPRRR